MFGWFKSLGRFFKKFVVVVFGKSAAKALAKAAKEVFKSAFGKIVLAIVSELSLSNLSNSEKREKAFEAIRAAARLQGLVVKSSLINLVIELAVLRLKDTTD